MRLFKNRATSMWLSWFRHVAFVAHPPLKGHPPERREGKVKNYGIELMLQIQLSDELVFMDDLTHINENVGSEPTSRFVGPSFHGKEEDWSPKLAFLSSISTTP